jgi:DNA-binding PadR family transcriptional regulator
MRVDQLPLLSGMSEAWLLSLVSRYPHRTALARKVHNGAVFPGLRSLERRGFVKRYHDQYRLTHRGRDELRMARAIALLVSRAESALR